MNIDGFTGDLEGQVEQQYTSFTKREPVVLGHGIAGVVGSVASLLVTHGVITDTQASALTQQVVSLAVFVVLLAQGFVVRHFVAPAWKAKTGRDFPSEVIEEPDGVDDAPGDEPAEPVSEAQEARLAGQV